MTRNTWIELAAPPAGVAPVAPEFRECRSFLGQPPANRPHSSGMLTAIAEVLSDVDAELAALEHRRDQTRALKQGVMRELLTERTRLV